MNNRKITETCHATELLKARSFVHSQSRRVSKDLMSSWCLPCLPNVLKRHLRRIQQYFWPFCFNQKEKYDRSQQKAHTSISAPYNLAWRPLTNPEQLKVWDVRDVYPARFVSPHCGMKNSLVCITGITVSIPLGSNTSSHQNLPAETRKKKKSKRRTGPFLRRASFLFSFYCTPLNIPMAYKCYTVPSSFNFPLFPLTGRKQMPFMMCPLLKAIHYSENFSIAQGYYSSLVANMLINVLHFFPCKTHKTQNIKIPENYKRECFNKGGLFPYEGLKQKPQPSK